MRTDWVEVPFEVPAQQRGLRLDAYLASRLHRYSRAEVQRLIKAGKVVFRGRAPKASVKVAGGDTVLIRYPRREEPPALHTRLPVLHEDEDILAVNKPGDVLSHPTDKALKNTVTSILAAQFPTTKLHLVHRLDRETSGVLVLAKNAAAARALVGQFTARRARKEYLAIVRGKAAFARRRVELPIGREGLAIKVRQAVVARDKGKAAATEFRRVEAGERHSLMRAAPETGRLHQIRVHLASLGLPVVGDKLYIGEGEAYLKAVRRELSVRDIEELGAPRQMLHAWRLALAHPATGAALALAAPLPPDFLECLSRAGLRPPPSLR